MSQDGIKRVSQDLAHKEGHHEPGHPAIKTGGEVNLVKDLNQGIRRMSLEMSQRRSKDEGEHQTLNFQVSHGLTTSEAETLLKQWGRNELVEKSTPVWLIIFRLVCNY